MKVQPKKITLAFSGGLDTSTIVPWLKENYSCEIIAVCVNIGQEDNPDAMEKHARTLGADEVFIINAEEEFAKEYVFPCLRIGAIYEGDYLLGTSMARPLIAKKLIEIALQEGADTICHGATGKGNDQNRFDLTIKALAPQLNILAPWRIWDLQSREDLIDYLDRHGVKHSFPKFKSYSEDGNLWHLSHEGVELEDPANAPNYKDILKNSVHPKQAPDQACTVRVEFEKGVPVAIDGKKLSPAALTREANKIGGKYGIGIVDMVENRVVGLKSRGVYETPGGTILYRAHHMLEQLCLDRQTLSLKQQLAVKYSELVYTGEWFTPLREALDAFVNVTQETVTGEVKVELYKGNVIPAGMKSPYSLYDQELASFTTGELYKHQDAEGFITLLGLPLKVRAMMLQNHAEVGV
jgi:argininosuccinate synthase